MLLPQTKEREHRFKLALRMGLPVFTLILAFYINALMSTNDNLNTLFYFEAILILVFSIYFIFFLIYNGYEVKITDEVSKTFTREFLYNYLKKEIKKGQDYTLVLISIDNLYDINSLYGLKNGDKTLYNTAKWIGEFLESKDIYNFPLGHVKGGDFIIGLHGDKNQYNTVLELICIKTADFKLNDIEVKISGAITDTKFSRDLDYLIENLYNIQDEKKNVKHAFKEMDMTPNELELNVIEAIKNRSIDIMTQEVFNAKEHLISECFVKLQTKENKLIHQKNFMKVINKLGLTIEFELIVFEEIVKKCKISKDIYAVNISPTSVRNPSFYLRVKEILDTNEDIKGRIIFLLSELEYYTNLEKYNNTLKLLRDNGIFIAIDRLGSIHTSFLYLRDLEIDLVRFDGFYSKENKIVKYKNVIDGFNTMAHDKGIKTWMKLIENEETKQIAESLNIDYLQGKYLANLEKEVEGE